MRRLGEGQYTSGPVSLACVAPWITDGTAVF